MGKWWRGLDSNQRTHSGQIYSLLDLTTLPPLHRVCPARDIPVRTGLQQGLSVFVPTCYARWKLPPPLKQERGL